MKFFRNLAGVLLTTAATAPVGVVTSILLARLLSTDDRGLYAIALTFATLSTMLFQFGWPTASIYRLRSARSSPAVVSGAALVFLGGTSLMVVSGLLALEPWLRERFLGDLPTVVFYLVLATLPFRALANGFGAIARGMDRFVYENWYSILLQLGNLLAILVAVWWLGGSLTELMAALAMVYVVLVPVLVVIVLRRTGLSLRIQSREMSRSFRFGLKTYAMTVTGRVHERVDIFMLAYLLADPTQVAFYAIARGGILLLQLLPNALGKVAYPQMAGLSSSDAADFACGLVRQGLLFTVPAALVLFVAAPMLLPFVYGESYAASAVPFMLLLPGVVLFGADRVISRYFTGTNQHKANVITRAVSLAVNVVLNYFWIPQYGIVGAAAAGLASYVVDAVLILTVFLTMTNHKIADLVVIRRSDLDPYRRQLNLLARRLRPGTP